MYAGSGGRRRHHLAHNMWPVSRRNHRTAATAGLLACLALASLLSGAAAEVFECGQTEPPVSVKKDVQQTVENHIATNRMAFSGVSVPVYFHVISQVSCGDASVGVRVARSINSNGNGRVACRVQTQCTTATSWTPRSAARLPC